MPLHRAAARGYMSIVSYLKEDQVLRDAIDDKGLKPFHVAAREGQVETFKILYNIDDNSNSDILSNAARGGHLLIVEHLTTARPSLERLSIKIMSRPREYLVSDVNTQLGKTHRFISAPRGEAME
jgi:ankyrin repeat protein